MIGRVSCAALGLVASVLVAGTASAQASSDAQARLHYQVAVSYYEQADYESALREFQSAYRLSQRPQLFFNISLCYQQLENLDESIAYLERYLNEVADIENRAALELRLTNLRTRRDQREVEASAPSAAPDAGAPPAGAVSTDPGDSTNVPAIVGFSVAAVGLVAGAIFTGLVLAEDARVSGLPCAAARTCSDSDVGTLTTFALVSDISWGVSLAGAIVGTIFLFVPTGDSPSSDAASLRLVPSIGQTSGLTLTGTF